MATISNPAKRQPCMINTLPKHPKKARNELNPTESFGKKHDQAAYYVADETVRDQSKVIRDRSKVIYLSFKQIDQQTNKSQVACLFASAMCAFEPDLQPAFMQAMEVEGIVPNVKYIPSEAPELCMDFSDMYEVDEILIFIGLSTMILFKNTTMKNYYSFIKARLKAMTGILLLPPEHASKIKFPISFQKAEMIKSVFGSNMELKRSLIRYMVKESDDYKSCMFRIARYTCLILSYIEMHIVMLIYEVLVESKSPVMQDPRIQHEVLAYTNVMMRIGCSEFPKFFRFFCSRDEVEMLQRRNFSILGAVAERVNYSMEFNDKTIDRSLDDPMVSELVGVHEHYIRTTLVTKKEAFGFLCEYGDEAEIMHEDM